MNNVNKNGSPIRIISRLSFKANQLYATAYKPKQVD